ncbi:SLC13 family permease [Neobacillus niacini]|uniref:SLC13 family permease n=1 Tax=Neobacillus niacini TaxID=86668 RepID=UPI002863AA52|nr:SLC13 family permease [Neobacillus niacini]MDR7001165.1 Na+/H+ antiporter NhaD/arsenite permease-like protein [Neobacillus niacini]
MKEYTFVQSEKKLHLKIGILKKDIVFTISLALAIMSCFIHTPKLEYINFKVVFSLFNLMLAVKALEDLKLLDKLAIAILNKCNNSKRVSIILILLCFFSSMLVTNDVALITFIPLTLIISKITEANMLDTIILQTIAANIGSSLTPMGNPQNLFIFSYYGLKPMQFFTTVLLLAVLGMILLYILNHRLKSKELEMELPFTPMANRKKTAVWGIVFCIITVSILGVISYKLAFLITLITVCVLDIKLLRKIDYLLLITFICFFIFIGNISDLVVVHTFANENLKSPTSIYFSSIFLSQLISNVPAAIFLSKFSMDWQPLLLGVNLGGLGTIIASLASVISYKLFIKNDPWKSKMYLIRFSIYNFSFLAFLTLVCYLISKIFNLF